MGVFFVGLLLIVGDVGFGCFDGCFFFPAFRTVLLLFFYDWFCVGLIWGSAYLIRPFALDELEV